MIEQQYLDYEKAITLVANSIPSDEKQTKPTVFHSIRVGTYLYLNRYSRDVILAGFMHDLIEDTQITLEFVAKEYGENVARLVGANTKNSDIKDSYQGKTDLINRCIDGGADAVFVKMSDVLDNYKYYERTKNKSELQYCSTLASLLFNRINQFPAVAEAVLNTKIAMELKGFLEKFPLVN